MLVVLRRHHGGQLRADLRRYYGLTWADFTVLPLLEAADLAAYLPDDSASMRAMNGGWTLTEQLLAGVWDALRVLAWQQTADGHKGHNAPQPIPRPGFEPQSSTLSGDRMTLAESKRWLKSRRE